MSYHYQINNDYFDSTSYLPQVQMQMHTGYDFYSTDQTSLMAAQTGIPHDQSQQQQQQQLAGNHNEHIVPYGWRSDWTTPSTSNNVSSNLGSLNVNVNVHSNWISPLQNIDSGGHFEATGINDAFRQISSSGFYLDPLLPSSSPTSSSSVRLLPPPSGSGLSEKKAHLGLSQHQQTAQKSINPRSTPKPFKCTICFKAFSQAANLTAHKRIHTGEKPFTCTVCRRPFSQSSSLVTHKRTHTGERPYPCAQCDKAFTDSSTLTKHLRTHTGQKPYGCGLCLMRFTQSGNLHRHMKTHKI